jgi:hypothetical protein
MSEQKKTPLQVFFELGTKATGGDPVKKSQFDYYFMWILFLAFVLLSARNWILFFQTWEVGYLPWALIGLAISWFQYHALKQFYHVKENMIKLHSGGLKAEFEPIEEESVDEMMEEFKS